MVTNKCSQVKGGGLPDLFQADAEHRLEVVLRVDLEGDMGAGLHDAWDPREPGRHDLGDFLVVLHPQDRDEVKLGASHWSLV